MGRAIHAPEMWARRSCWMRSSLLGPGSWVIVIVHRRDEIRPGRREKKCDELVFVDIGFVYLCIDGASKLCVWKILVYMWAM